MACETEQKINDAVDAFFKAFASNTSPIAMLVHFSNTSPVVLQHGPKTCPYPFRWRVAGLNAVRSYFDLIATTWSRSNVKICEPPKIDVESRRAVVELSANWTWRKSGRSWTEDFTWDLEFDEGMKIVNFVVRTTSDPATCLMRAVDGVSKKYTELTVSTSFATPSVLRLTSLDLNDSAYSSCPHCRFHHWGSTVVVLVARPCYLRSSTARSSAMLRAEGTPSPYLLLPYDGIWRMPCTASCHLSCRIAGIAASCTWPAHPLGLRRLFIDVWASKRFLTVFIFLWDNRVLVCIIESTHNDITSIFQIRFLRRRARTRTP